MASSVDVAVRVPAELMDEAKAWAERDATPVDQFIRHAIEQRIALREAAYLAERAARGSRDDFARILAKAGTEPPRPGDELPDGWLPGA
jgi:predicted DNA-binding protein